MIFVGRDHTFCLNTTRIRISWAKKILQSNSLNSGSFLYNSGRPGDHAPFLDTPGNSGRLGRSAIGYVMYCQCSCFQDSPERTDSTQTPNVMFASKDVTLTIGSQTKVHRVGPFTGWNAVMFWGAIVAAVATTVAMATTKWFTYGNYHQGLWRWCLKSVCENNPDMVGENHYKPYNEMISI